MPKRWLIVMACWTSASCGSATENRATLAAEIERQVHAAHPTIALERYARFYAETGTGSVRAVYVYANPGREPIAGAAGKVTWTTAEDLPEISDGACWVLRFEFDIVARRLRGMECNGPGNE